MKKIGVNVFRLFLVTLNGTEANERIKKGSKQGIVNLNSLEANRVPFD